MVFLYAVNVKKEEQMSLSKQTKTVAVKCSSINEGDVLLSAILGDTVRVVKITPGEGTIMLTLGGNGAENTTTVEYDSYSKFYKIDQNTLN